MADDKIKVQKTMTNLADLSDITLVKTVDFVPPADVQAAHAALGNDQAKILAVLTAGMRAEIRRSLANDTSVAWHSLTDEGEINGEFSGEVADSGKVGVLVLTLAKTIFGYDKSQPIEERRKAKESAVAMIKGNEAIMAGLKKTAALTDSTEE